jgi:D-glycero-alpha-D-manno-heptose-7-phosphate kinase
LGSSSTFTVGLLNALYAYQGKFISKQELAHQAIYVERKMIKERVGCQDQVLAAYGGFNYIQFKGINNVEINPVNLRKERIQDLNNNLMMFFTKITRHANDVLEEQIKRVKINKNRLKTMHNMVMEGLKILQSNHPLDEFGKLLHESWLLKRELSSAISNDFIDEVYGKARKAGAVGGKLLGAGSGGFLIFYVEPDFQRKVEEALHPLEKVKFEFDNSGSRIIFAKTN